MSWQEIIKVSSLEGEIAQEYAPEDMKDFNELNKLITQVEETLADLMKNMTFDNDIDWRIRNMFREWIKDLKHLQNEGRPQEHHRIEPKIEFGERNKQRMEVFPKPWEKQGWTPEDIAEWKKQGHTVR